jgi:hypothetical protein
MRVWNGPAGERHHGVRAVRILRSLVAAAAEECRSILYLASSRQVQALSSGSLSRRRGALDRPDALGRVERFRTGPLRKLSAPLSNERCSRRARLSRWVVYRIVESPAAELGR